MSGVAVACPRPERGELTVLLRRWRDGDQEAVCELVPLVYQELRRLAQHILGGERSDHTLVATALVHEAYLSLAGRTHPDLRDRAHFFSIAAMLMRRVLVDHARKRAAVKRGGGDGRMAMRDGTDPARGQLLEILAIDRALRELAARDPRKARVVELRFFGGLTIAETAVAIGMARATVIREWRMARAWLRRELRG